MRSLSAARVRAPLGVYEPAVPPRLDDAQPLGLCAGVNYLAGVDEAGLGPILGPLVVGGVTMAGPEGTAPWRLLQGHVSKLKHVKGKVRVADSKKVRAGPHGMLRLEETALVFWTALHGEPPTDLASWLVALGHDLEPLQRCPWYEELALPLPRIADRDWVTLTGALVARALRRGGAELLDIAVRAVDVEEWNVLIADTDNKSRAHFHAYSEVLGELVRRLWPRIGEDDACQLVADRCGGRMRYRADLARLCPEADVTVQKEAPGTSSYQLQQAHRDMTVTFAERAEDRAFPTALASCFAKYLRELMIESLNRWFQARVPDLKPTAGYYVDGHRFLDDVQEQVEALALPRHRLVRVR